MLLPPQDITPTDGVTGLLALFDRVPLVALGEVHGLEQEHIARGAHSLSISMTMDDLWLERSPDIMAVQTIASWTGRFRFVLEDLLSLPGHPPIVAEGAGLFPEIVQPLLSRPRQAIWLVASPTFLTTTRHKRGMTLPGLTSNPEQAAKTSSPEVS